MRATVMYGAGDVRIENVPDARLIQPTDALVHVTRAGICGSDLWPYNSMEPSETGRRMGHEFIGIVEAVGRDVSTIKAADLVVSPFLWSDGTCVFCRRGLHSACLHGGRYATALDIARPGGAVGRVGVPQDASSPVGVAFWKNIRIAGGPAPARAYMQELLVDVLDGKIEPGRVFDRVGPLDEVPDGYRAMNDREAIKVLIEP